jgi:hypothetical protein
MYLYEDFFISTTLALTMSYTKPADKLSVDRLPGTLLNRQNLVSVFGAVVI